MTADKLAAISAVWFVTYAETIWQSPHADTTAELLIGSRHDAGNWRATAPITFDHPQLAPVILDREKLLLNGTDGIMLVIYHPEPGSQSAEKLSLLASASLIPAAPGTVAGSHASLTARHWAQARIA